MIFDTHAHYDDPQFDADRHEILSGMADAGIGRIVDISADVPSWEKVLELTRRYPFVYGALGVHPSDVDGLNEETFAWLEAHIHDEKIVAVGEIGLDYYWEKDPARRENQRYWFRRQFALARREHMPVVIHSREAAQETYEMLRDMHAEELPVVIHCYSYTPEMAGRFLSLNCRFGIGGVLTFKNAKKLRETAAMLPMENILLETDCPYLAPEPNRGKRNSSMNLPYVVKTLAEIRGMSEEEIIALTEQNAEAFYGLS